MKSDARKRSALNWMEFRDWVPAEITTFLLPLGKIEPYGVTANGADILAPAAIVGQG